MYINFNALKNFKSPNVSRRRADIAFPLRYMPECTLNAALADGAGCRKKRDGANRDDDAYRQQARQRVLLFSGSVVTCRCLWKRDRREGRQQRWLALPAASSRPVFLSLQPGSPWSNGQDQTRTPPRQGCRIQTGTKRRHRTLIPRCHDERRIGSMLSFRGLARRTASHHRPARDVRLSCRTRAPRSPCCVPISARQ